MKIPLFPDQASTSASQVDALYFFLIGMSLCFLALIFLPIIYFLFKYRRGNTADRSPLRISTMKIEVTWTVIPLLLAMGLFAWGARVYFNMEMPPADALEINVVGKQWMWKTQHPEGNREINELHVPVGRTVKLTLASEDVIHSFFIPAFRIKQDVVPGRFTTEWFKPTKVGTYHLFCAEFCGTSHSKMIGTIYVLNPAQYQEWLNQGSIGDTLAQSGARLFRELGCSGCHVGNATVRSPRLEGLYGKLVPLQGGQVVRADEKYLRDSILLPAAQVTAGYEPLMPTFQGHITEEQLLQLIAYIKSLANQQPEEMR
ncbi:MAG: cytochrome c oxidase subunit II [Verrucomicrobia bacterium]|nr:MAG: cytochrome c oxidase subunit II [Verrucomicrobiota bacterium]